jgi:SRSO17 transposase
MIRLYADSVMRPLLEGGGRGRLTEYLGRIGEILGHDRRRASFATYALGLLSNAERKSIEPLAAQSCPEVEQVGAVHQQLQHFIVDSRWRDREVRLAAARHPIEALTEREPIETWQIDDTGFLKQGTHSVGVQRQYKIEQACEMIRRAVANGIPRGVVLADASSGDEPSFRSTVRSHDLQYAVGIKSDNRVWKLDRRGRRAGEPLTVRQLARSLDPRCFRRLVWRQGTGAPLAASFAMLRVVPAYRSTDDDIASREKVWLICRAARR